MAKSTPKQSRRLWRGILAGAAVVPFAVFAAAPAVSAAGTHESESSQSEQLPGLPGTGDLPGGDLVGGLDVQALLDLQSCLTDLQAALGDTAGETPVPAPVPLDKQEQLGGLPPLPGAGGDTPALPDVAAMNETCQTVLASVQGSVPDVPAPDVPAPADEPAGK